jgi:hypothetical protein
MSRRPFLLYHWSPVSRRNSIARLGLVPGKLPVQSSQRFPYVCFATSPSLAWGLSAEFSDEVGEWDLWMVWSTAVKGRLERLHRVYGRNRARTTPAEYRAYERIFKRDVWWVGTRIHVPRGAKL